MLGKGHAALLKRAELKTFVNFHGNEVCGIYIYVLRIKKTIFFIFI